METISKQPKSTHSDTKERIIDTARKLFSESSYLGVSMDDIAKKVAIKKASLYYHFTSKAEIYSVVLDQVSNDINAFITEALNEQTPEKRLCRIIKDYLNFGSKERNLIKAIILNLPEEPAIQNRVVQIRKQIDETIQPLINDIFITKKLSRRVDPLVLTSLLTCMMDGFIVEHSFFDERIDSDKITDQMIAILF
jgi:AcrR family transcriptional regulator